MPRRIVELMPSEALREPFEVDVGDDGLNEAVAERLEEIECRPKLLKAWSFVVARGERKVNVEAAASRPRDGNVRDDRELLRLVRAVRALDGLAHHKPALRNLLLRVVRDQGGKGHPHPGGQRVALLAQ